MPIGKHDLDKIDSCFSKCVKNTAIKNGHISVNHIIGTEFDNRIREWSYVRVKNIKKSSSDTYCVEVPSDGFFIQNGFRHGNSQGGSFKDVFIFDESWAFREHADNWLYTAITRAEEKLTVIIWAYTILKNIMN